MTEDFFTPTRRRGRSSSSQSRMCYSSIVWGRSSCVRGWILGRAAGKSFDVRRFDFAYVLLQNRSTRTEYRAGGVRQLLIVHLVVVLNAVTDWRGKRSPSNTRPGCTGAD
jgi:hypothetical protein